MTISYEENVLNGENMQNTQKIYQLILELNKLKLVFRNTSTSFDRKESTAEHSWSVSMIVMILPTLTL